MGNELETPVWEPWTSVTLILTNRITSKFSLVCCFPFVVAVHYLNKLVLFDLLLLFFYQSLLYCVWIQRHRSRLSSKSDWPIIRTDLQRCKKSSPWLFYYPSTKFPTFCLVYSDLKVVNSSLSGVPLFISPKVPHRSQPTMYFGSVTRSKNKSHASLSIFKKTYWLLVSG